MRIHEAAKKLGLDSKDIIALMKEKGLEAKNHMSKIDEALLAELEAKAAKTAEEPAKEPAAAPPAIKEAPVEAPEKKPVISAEKTEEGGGG